MKYGLLMVCLLVLVLGGCPAPSLKVPITEKIVTHELADLYLTTDPNQMSGVPKEYAKLGPNESITIYARGVTSIETGSKWFILPEDTIVNWKATEGVEITPTKGHAVMVKVVNPTSKTIFITATTTTKEGKKIERIFTIEIK